ncbi:MAG: tRNA pseudouridine(38-40) synthase TruA, partial [SAR324 cluster bacterium]|nr:tRNA pseudouridine(38-40) synthase TruA [SAR324 cluster bacterium]
PGDISVKELVEVPSDFYPRKESQGKRYSYVIHHEVSPPALTREFVWWVKKSLDLKAMEEAIAYYAGEHDFSAFRGPNCTADSPVKFIKYANMSVKKLGKANIITFDIMGSGFVRHMIRNMIGMLVMVGRGEFQPLDVKKALDEKTCKNKLKAAASGLCLEEIFFDPDPFSVAYKS